MSMNTTQRSLLRVLRCDAGQTTSELAQACAVSFPEAEAELLALAERDLSAFFSPLSGWVLTEKGLDHRLSRMGSGASPGDEFSDVPTP